MDVFKYLVSSLKIEVAGFLLGTSSEGLVRVEELVVGDNLDSSPYSFKLEPYAIVKCYELARILNLEVVALIHSHPAPPYPSVKDRTGMRLWPLPWIIVDSMSMEFRAWVLKQEDVEEVPIILTPHTTVSGFMKVL
ncbi:MAG: Mov34/MPN/PAD-1 family protein [Sulfolobales archaeon]